MTTELSDLDCIIVGAGPGGLQAALHLARYNRRVLLVDRGGGRTRHAAHIVNYLGLEDVSGSELIRKGLEQVRSFGVVTRSGTVVSIGKRQLFEVRTRDEVFRAPFVVVSAGALDTLPRLGRLAEFFGRSFFTCVDCDGHRTTGKNLLVMGNNLNAARLALGMKQMYTVRIALLAVDYDPPSDYVRAIRDEGIEIVHGEPVELLGEEELTGVLLADGRVLPCEAIMATFGWRLNDGFLAELSLRRDSNGFKILTNEHCESSLSGLYVVGAMRQGHAQAVIAAGQGAAAAIDINHRLLTI